MWEQSY
jgi:hypothetical protein